MHVFLPNKVIIVMICAVVILAGIWAYTVVEPKQDPVGIDREEIYESIRNGTIINSDRKPVEIDWGSTHHCSGETVCDIEFTLTVFYDDQSSESMSAMTPVEMHHLVESKNYPKEAEEEILDYMWELLDRRYNEDFWEIYDGRP